VRQRSLWLHDSHGDRQVSLEGQAFSPRFTPDGKKLCYRIRKGDLSELWVADLDSNQTEPLLPDFPMAGSTDPEAVWHPGYDISADGRKLVFFSLDRGGKLRLWVAPLDHSSAPRQIPGVEGEQPLFGPNGEIFFRKVEGTSASLYSVREDGSVLRKASDRALIDLVIASPDHKWLVAGVPPEGPVLLPASGGDPIVTHLHPPIWPVWTGDGKSVFLSSVNASDSKTYVFGLSAGQILPANIEGAKDFLTEDELAKMRGVRIIQAGDVVPGPTAEIYAYTRASVQRNLYRIPIK